MPYLNKHFRTMLIDMPGYAKGSSYHGHFDIDALANALVPAIPEKSILCGWSLGGIVAIRIAGILKNRIKALALITSTPCFIRKEDWLPGIDKVLIETMHEKIAAGEKEKVLKEFALLIASGGADKKLVLRKLNAMIPDQLPDRKVLEDGLKVLIETDLREGLQSLTIPVVMLLSDNDQLIAMETGQEMKKIFPAAKIHYMNSSGHAPFISMPEEFCNRLISSLQDVKANG